MGEKGGTQHLVMRVIEPKKMGARSARAERAST